MTDSSIRIYVENKGGQSGAYMITEALVRGALHSEEQGAHINVCNAEQPDLVSLAKATHFVGFGFDTRRIKESAPRLRIVHCTNAGVEGYMPLNWLPEGAVFTNSSGVHEEKGGSYGAMALLMLNEFIPRHASQQRVRQWERTLSTAIAGKTVVVYGFGSLGSAVARRIRPFGVKVIGVRRSGREHPDADAMCRPADLAAVLPKADFLVLACPLTPETRGLVGASQLAAMPCGAGLVNIARGPVVDNHALVAALASGQLSGAVLDVFDPEPLPASSPLWDVPNLVITPHTSCDDARGDLQRCLDILGDNIARERVGQALLNVVDGGLGY